MKDELVMFDTAKLAREKGFDELCRYYFVNNTLEEVLSGIFTTNSRMGEKYPTAPTQSLLQRWLREKYNAYINITPYYGSEYDTGLQAWELTGLVNTETEERHMTGRPRYKKYEEALEEGLKQALNLIK